MPDIAFAGRWHPSQGGDFPLIAGFPVEEMIRPLRRGMSREQAAQIARSRLVEQGPKTIDRPNAVSAPVRDLASRECIAAHYARLGLQRVAQGDGDAC